MADHHPRLAILATALVRIMDRKGSEWDAMKKALMHHVTEIKRHPHNI